jgi:hypothetical protein
MLNRECPSHRAGDRAALTGLEPTTGISLRAYLLQLAWAHEEQADGDAAQRS